MSVQNVQKLEMEEINNRSSMEHSIVKSKASSLGSKRSSRFTRQKSKAKAKEPY